MTKLLEEAIKAASELPPEEQDALAAILLDELSSERRWAKQFAGSQDKLSALAEEALGHAAKGKTRRLDESL